MSYVWSLADTAARLAGPALGRHILHTGVSLPVALQQDGLPAEEISIHVVADALLGRWPAAACLTPPLQHLRHLWALEHLALQLLLPGEGIRHSTAGTATCRSRACIWEALWMSALLQQHHNWITICRSWVPGRLKHTALVNCAANSQRSLRVTPPEAFLALLATWMCTRLPFVHPLLVQV